MDPASVEAALTLNPALPGRFAWDGTTLVFTPNQPWPLGGTVTVSLSGGRSRRGLPLLGGRTWSFTVGLRRLVYLAGRPNANLWLLPVDEDGPPQQVTDEPLGLYDYGVSPDGLHIALSTRRPDQGTDLRLLDLATGETTGLLACPGEACLSPAYSPDGRWLAYQRHSLVPGLAAGELTFGPSQIYLRSLADPAAPDQPVGEPGGRFPRWGPDSRLSYLDTTRAAIAVHALNTGAVSYVPNASGDPGTWSPDASAIVFAELVFPEHIHDPGESEEEHAALTEDFFSYLVRVVVATNESVVLSGDGLVDDGSPSFAPSGAWLAFGRKTLTDDQWTPGRQLWLMRPDGSEAYALTDDPLYNHSAFRWSPDSRTLAYMRFNVADPGLPAEIWTVDMSESQPSRLVEGFLPEWLP
jgi:Tol biopolymer transport system component